MAKKKNTADGSDLGSEFDDLEFTANDPIGDSNDDNTDDTTDDSQGTTGSPTPESKITTPSSSKTTSKPSNRGKKKGVATLDDYVAYTRKLEASGYFKKYKTTSVNVTINVSNLSSQISKNYDKLSHYQLVSGIIMKVFNDNKDEVKRILDEQARKNTEGLMD